MARSLKGLMEESGVNMVLLANVLNVTRSTLYRKIRSGNFTVREIRTMLKFFRIDDPVLAYDIFLRPPSQ